MTRPNKKDFAAYFFLECSNPFCFYLYYIYFSPILKSFGYSSPDIISHNFLLSIIDCLVVFPLIYLVKIFNPIKILKFQAIVLLLIVVSLPIFAMYLNSGRQVFLFQAILFPFSLSGVAVASPIFIKRFNVDRRFTTTTIGYALARSFMYVVTAFGLVYLTEWIGHSGVCVIGLPLMFACFWSIRHFEKLEGLRPHKSFVPINDEVHSQAA